MFERVPTRALSDTVAEQLLKQIEAGTFARDTKLPTEASLSQQFGVSRTVVREAIARLKHDGVVEPRQGSGVFVRLPNGLKPLRLDVASLSDLQSVLHIVDVRRALESEVAAQAAERRSDEAMARIDAALAQIDADVANGDSGHNGVKADIAFHRTIAEATGNPFFLSTLAFLGQYLETGMHVTRSNESRHAEFARQVREEHAAIAAAIRARDPQAAHDAARNHMVNAARRLSAGAATSVSQ
ncbi:FadR/GntR family transcriptional regulator [Chitinasiproducens palmae]|uniref:DNA-binding transcriptional regulator, FadR family n=1 Tax=Chitinasiproducens palmae TaxID=1770053 RepID=A0A1H2PTE5_9BURK|nr:FadR/GntR family transcriptional regulator [Chitinasiproducens palmae]SDV50377.1 DNA-binding transcriptional regulator, FadR family [Chitinasiproducens palmae]